MAVTKKTQEKLNNYVKKNKTKLSAFIKHIGAGDAKLRSQKRKNK